VFFDSIRNYGTRGVVRGLAEARAAGFSMLPEFPTLRDARSPFRSAYLFPADRIELAEHRRDDDDLTVPLYARVSGTRYHQGLSALANPAQGFAQ
jgi:hypothetical protein